MRRLPLFAALSPFALLAACGGDEFRVAISPDASIDAGLDAIASDDGSSIGDSSAADAPDANAARLVWAKAFGGPQAQKLTGLAVLPSGNPVLAGTMAGSMSLGGSSLTSAGGTDIFVGELDGASGAHLLSTRFGDPAAQIGLDVTATPSGDVFFAGMFQGTISFAPTSTLVANLDGSFDAFVAHLSPNGGFVSTFAYQGPGFQVPWGIAVDPSAALVVAGENSGAMSTPAQTVNSKGGADAFVSRVNGSSAFSAGYGDGKEQRALGVALDPSGNIIVVGELQGALDFGGGSQLVVSSGGFDAFVAKLEPGGKLIWAKAYGNALDQRATSVGVDPVGNIVVGGNFSGQISFGGAPLDSAGLSDAFVAVLDPNGTHMWSKRFGGAGSETVTDLDVDTKGNVLLSGELASTADFGSGVLTSAGLSDVYVAAFDATGVSLGSARFGDADAQTAGHCAFVAGGFYLAGSFRGSIALDDARSFTSSGEEDIFVARFTR